MHCKAITLTLATALTAATCVSAQQAPVTTQGNGGAPPPGVTIPKGVETPPDYVIGPDDVLTVVFWREKDLSNDVTVRPDGMITLPLVNDVQAAGRTPDQLREDLSRAAAQFIEVPTVTVVVKAINSRKVFITGQVGKQGAYPLLAPTTVMQMLATAGGVHEFADTKNITILRTENGRQLALKFNYKDVRRGRNLKQNIELKPGDTIIVP